MHEAIYIGLPSTLVEEMRRTSKFGQKDAARDLAPRLFDPVGPELGGHHVGGLVHGPRAPVAVRELGRVGACFVARLSMPVEE